MAGSSVLGVLINSSSAQSPCGWPRARPRGSVCGGTPVWGKGAHSRHSAGPPHSPSPRRVLGLGSPDSKPDPRLCPVDHTPQRTLPVFRSWLNVGQSCSSCPYLEPNTLPRRRTEVEADCPLHPSGFLSQGPPCHHQPSLDLHPNRKQTRALALAASFTLHCRRCTALHGHTCPTPDHAPPTAPAKEGGQPHLQNGRRRYSANPPLRTPELPCKPAAAVSGREARRMRTAALAEPLQPDGEQGREGGSGGTALQEPALWVSQSPPQG